MGFLGLFIGPVLMALLVAIWREWLHEVEVVDNQPAETPSTEPEAIASAAAEPVVLESRKVQAG